LGGTTSANSLPVVLSSDGPFAVQTGAITETAPATDIASSGLNGRLQRIAQRLTSLIALLPASLGAKTAAASLAVTLATDDVSIPLLGAVNETAPATDIASSGHNGRLQRIAQRITSLIALVPAALDANGFFKVGAGGYAVVIANTLTRPANTTAYAAGDEVTDTGGGIQTVTNAVRVNGGTGTITGVEVTCSVNAATKMVGEIRYYDTTSTPATDNAAFDASDTVNDTAIATVPFSLGSDGLTGTTGNCLYEINGLNIDFAAGGATRDIYWRIILKAAYTSPSNSDTIKVKTRIRQD
jgi:hypothetical protein